MALGLYADKAYVCVAVVWDDDAVAKLCDRSQVGDQPEGEADEKGGFNDYLRSFKVASYQLKDTNEEEVVKPSNAIRTICVGKTRPPS